MKIARVASSAATSIVRKGMDAITGCLCLDIFLTAQLCYWYIYSESRMLSISNEKSVPT